MKLSICKVFLCVLLILELTAITNSVKHVAKNKSPVSKVLQAVNEGVHGQQKRDEEVVEKLNKLAERKEGVHEGVEENYEEIEEVVVEIGQEREEPEAAKTTPTLGKSDHIVSDQIATHPNNVPAHSHNAPTLARDHSPDNSLVTKEGTTNSRVNPPDVPVGASNSRENSRSLPPLGSIDKFLGNPNSNALPLSYDDLQLLWEHELKMREADGRRREDVRVQAREEVGSAGNCNDNEEHGQEHLDASMQVLYPDLQQKLAQARNTLLETLDCSGRTNCSKVILSSDGAPALRHPPRFGLYQLSSLYQGFPVYTRQSSSQHLFYQREFELWDYAHRIERWIVGPSIGDSMGGLMLLSSEICPWQIDFSQTPVFFYDRRSPNPWNPRGNGWRRDDADSVRIQCYDDRIHPAFDCGCQRLNVSADGGRVAEYHPNKFGIYQNIPHLDNFLAPIYKLEGGEEYLYSHSHDGQLWLMGQTLITWSLRLNLARAERSSLDQVGFCPQDYNDYNDWEYLQRKEGETEVWLRDNLMKVECID